MIFSEEQSTMRKAARRSDRERLLPDYQARERVSKVAVQYSK